MSKGKETRIIKVIADLEFAEQFTWYSEHFSIILS